MLHGVGLNRLIHGVQTSRKLNSISGDGESGRCNFITSSLHLHFHHVLGAAVPSPPAHLVSSCYLESGQVSPGDLRLRQCRLFHSFYRETRMHSADYAVARCLSVCHTPVLSLSGYTILKVFSPSGSPTILVFPYQTGCQYSDGPP